MTFADKLDDTTSAQSPKTASDLRFIPLVLLGAVMIGSLLLPASPIFSEWESVTAYSIYGAQESSLEFAISRYANVGGLNYAILEASRLILEITGLPVTLTSIRIPALICGTVCLGFFFVIGSRWFGSWSSLAATALLAVNPIFSQYTRELIVLAPSLLAFTIFLERLQWLTRKTHSMWAWALMTLSFAVVLLLYGPGRIMAAVIFVSWVAILLVQPRQTNGTRARFLIKVALVPCGAAITLFVLYPANLEMFGSQLLFPGRGESALILDTGVSLAQTLLMNLQITAESLLLAGGSFHSSFLEATNIQGRYPIFPVFIVPLFVIGLALCVLKLRPSRVALCTKEAALVGLFVVTTVPMLSSSIFLQEDVDGTSYLLSSLVNFRLAYALIAGYLLVGFCAAWITVSSGWIGSSVLRKAGTAVVVMSLFSISVLADVGGRESFRERMNESDPSLVGIPGWEQWLNGYALKDRSVSWGSHFQQHNQYQVAIDAITEAVSTKSNAGHVAVVWAPLACFPEAPLKTHSLGEIEGRNYHSFFLAAYLSDRLPQTSVGFVFIPPETNQQESRGGKEALWSATLSRSNEDLPIDYSNPGTPRITTLNGEEPVVVIATTPLELEYATALPALSQAQVVVLPRQGCSGGQGTPVLPNQA